MILVKYERSFVYSLVIILIFLLIYFFWLASSLTVHFCDSFQYLNNAKVLIGLNSFYDFTRPPFFPILLTPIMLIYSLTDNQFCLEQLPYFYMVVMNLGVLYCFWKLLNIGLKREISLLILIFFLLNRVVFHFIPFVLADLLSTGLVLLMILSFYQLWKTEHYKYALLTGLWLGLAGATKHYLVMLSLAPFFFMILESIDWNNKSINLKLIIKYFSWFLIIGFTGVTIFLLLHKIAYFLTPEFHNQPFFQLFIRNIKDLKTISNAAGTFNTIDNIVFNLRIVIKAFPLLILILAIGGVINSILLKNSLSKILSVFFLSHMVTMTFIVPYPELRYLLPIFPIVYYFVGSFFNWAIDYHSKESSLKSNKVNLVNNVVLIITMISVLYSANVEMKVFSEECHYDDVLIRLSRYIKENTTPSNRVLWVGGYFTLSPEKKSFIDIYTSRPEDHYLFQSVSTSIIYYSGRMGYNFYPYYFLPAFVGDPKEGDLIVINPEDPSEPLQIYQFKELWQFERVKLDNKTAIFVEPKTQFSLTIDEVDGGLELRGQLPKGLLWSLNLQSKKNIFTNALPVFQYPTRLKPSDQPLYLKELESFSLIPLNHFSASFSPRPLSNQIPQQ